MPIAHQTSFPIHFHHTIFTLPSLPFLTNNKNMFGQHGNELPFDCFLKHHDQFSLGNTPVGQPTFSLPPSLHPPLAIPGNEHDSVSGELGYSSSGCSSYVGSPSCTSYGTHSTTLIQSSISCHSLPRNSEVYSSSPGYVELENSSVREVLSIGDFPQGVQHNQWSNSPLANENSIVGSMSRATPYSPEEKKERIERYRSKRNLRNFNKKIKYECRKTLADSRPRVRGRFARTDEMDRAPQSQWDHPYVEEDDNNDCNWISILDTLSANLMP